MVSAKRPHISSVLPTRDAGGASWRSPTRSAPYAADAFRAGEMGIEAVDIVRYPNTIESRPGSASAVVLEVAYRQQTRILHRGRVGIRRSDLLGWRGDGALFGAARRLGIDSSLRRPAQAHPVPR